MAGFRGLAHRENGVSCSPDAAHSIAERTAPPSSNEPQRVWSGDLLQRALTEWKAPCFEPVTAEVDVTAMPITAVDADLEPVAAKNCWQSIATADAQAPQRNALIEELNAGFAA